MTEPLAATRNACKLCAPLGACLALRGVEGAVPFLHGSQGCATYIRRYLISHFREPVDIAVSGFSEATTVFGGGDNLRHGLNNVARQYHPGLIGIATTCLPETIGEDVGFLLHDFRPEGDCPVVHVATPSYRGTHVDGFHATIRALVEQLAEGGPASGHVNVFPGMVSPAEGGTAGGGVNVFPGMVSPAEGGTASGGVNVFPAMVSPAEGGTAGGGVNVFPGMVSPAEGGTSSGHVNVFPGMVSPADLRYLKEVFADFGLEATLLPDYSETLDGPQLDEFQKIPAGGTPVASLRAMGRARMSLELGRTLADTGTAAASLEKNFGVARRQLGWPVGVLESDRFFAVLSELSGRPTPAKHAQERGRLVDSYVDAHKYVFGRRAVVFGEEDLVVGLTAFLAEIGVQPVLCASGGESGRLAEAVGAVSGDAAENVLVKEGMDFATMGEVARGLAPDFLIGSSKGYGLARELDIPLIRAGFPIHDRIGGQRILHLGYRGAQQLFDAVTNTLLARAQERSPVGYSYL